MNDDHKDREKDSCARCGWVEFQAQPYGAIEYVCERRHEPLSSTALTKRCCSEFKT
ncbi:MAG: hypothetical protein ABL955_10610 [Elusimicrobiota bacterium]